MSTPEAPDISGLRFVRLIGLGGYSTVYLYERERPRMEVAVKVMNSDALTADAQDLTAEANAMAQLSQHPYIAQVHGADVTFDGRPYIVMKYYPGQSYALRSKEAPFAVSDVLRAGIHIACAVETAHREGILHRDIKPANILTDQYDNPALTDFGIAAIATEQTSDSDQEGMSLPWAPREVVYGTSKADARSDVYSLGATLWHLLVGRSPFVVPGGDNSTLALMRRIDAGAPPTTGRGDVPTSLERLLSSCMARSPGDRPGSALELARSLQAIEQELHLPVTALTLAGETSSDRASASAGGDPTRVRAPQSVVAQPPGPETRRRPKPVIEEAPAPSATAAGQPRRQRVLLDSPTAAGTVQRPRAVVPEAEEVEPKDEEQNKPHGRRRLVAAAVVVIALGGGTAALLARGSPANTAASEGTSSTQSQPQSLGPSPSPGTPAVRVSTVDGGTAVLFRWGGYANQLSSDSYRWRRSGSGTPGSGTSTKPSLRVKIAKGQVVCLSVQVTRQDGSSPSSFSDVACSR